MENVEYYVEDPIFSEENLCFDDEPVFTFRPIMQMLEEAIITSKHYF